MRPGLDTLPDYNRGDFPTLGPALVFWAIENDVRVLDGKLAGKPFIPTAQQRKFLAHWYRLYPEGHPRAGEFVYRSGAIRLSRGLFKSPLGAFISVMELVGPVRFAGWDHQDSRGMLIGARSPMALIQMCAVSEAQVSNSFRYVAEWCASATTLAQRFNLDAGKTQVFAPAQPGIPGGKIAVTTSSAATVRGSRPTFVLADELSEWTDSNGGTRFWDVLTDNSTKVEGSRILGLMNAHSPGSGSVAEQLHEQHLVAFDDPDSRFLYWSRETDPACDWSDADQIRECLEWIYEDAPWVSIDQVMNTVMNPTKLITSSMKEYGSLIVSDLSSWASKQDWDANRVDDRLSPGDEIVLALDPAITEDCTVLIACRVSDGLAQPLFAHSPQASGKDLNVASLDAAVAKAFETYKVLAWAADVHPLEGRVLVDWADAYGDRLLIDASPKGRIAFDMRAYKLDFARAAELTADDIIQGSVPHTGDVLLSQHVVNAQRAPHREYVSLGRGNRERKIDAAITLVLARLIRRKLLDSPEYEKRNRSTKVLVFRR